MWIQKTVRRCGVAGFCASLIHLRPLPNGSSTFTSTDILICTHTRRTPLISSIHPSIHRAHSLTTGPACLIIAYLVSIIMRLMTECWFQNNHKSSVSRVYIFDVFRCKKRKKKTGETKETVKIRWGQRWRSGTRRHAAFRLRSDVLVDRNGTVHMDYGFYYF